MTRKTKFKASISTLVMTGFLGSGLAACKAPNPTQGSNDPAAQTNIKAKLPPIRTALACLPDSAAIIAAHRGTDERWKDQAENSLGALKALIDHGTLMAEVDVAGLKDGTLITFHDGVWDEISTGRGPIASSQKSDLEKILLKSRDGGLTADRPPLFTDMLAAAKGKIYVEVDFKSSAKYRPVIKAIRNADMADQVLLIAYSSGQAQQLARLAPEMLRSNPKDAPKKDQAVWLGYEVANGNTAAHLKENGSYTIGRIGDPRRQPPLKQMQTAADILVTDQAERYAGVVGLKGSAKAEYEACLGD